MTNETRFVSTHRPAPQLRDGTYTVTVRQDLTIRGQARGVRAVSRRFVVAGDHRALAPEDVVSVFPPEGSLGDHANVLPHVLLGRGTLPWEQTGGDDTSDLPWLALLLFDEDDQVDTRVLTLAEIAALPGFGDEPPMVGQRDDDRAVVLGVPRDRLAELIPTAAELSLLTHVRQKVVAGRAEGAELAAVLSARLPTAGRTSTAHLVSVAGRYRDGGFALGTGDVVHLISLKSWRFACVQDGPGFAGFAESLDRTPATVSLPARGRPSVDPYLTRGFVPLPHRLRQAERTVSWYHGPLSPQRSAGPGPTDLLPVRAADALLRVDPDNGMIDVSYASAWQLGRLLALRSKRFSTGYGNWRQARRRAHHADGQVTPVPVLSATGAADPAPPEVVDTWLADLNRLTDVPFNYLVPDERMLPAESLRFFHLDPWWIRCLLDGALSLGRVTAGDVAYDREHLADLGAPRYPMVSGFLIRSALVSGFPGMLIDGYDVPVPENGDLTGLTPMTALPARRLSETVLLCLFLGDVSTLHLHLRPETLHFGVDHDPHAPTGWRKLLRDDTGKLKKGRGVPVGWRRITRAGTARPVEQVVDVAALAGDIGGPMNPARFAKEMIEGVPSVLFRRS
ncbi:hypothetical protein ABT023_19165 [Micromonospora sp. NPDC002296]|uniref:hypothetical protein n=1 Tax=Micromonospora sp. NPDC002296 TaxID=3154271 RepID=UPI003317A662